MDHPGSRWVPLIYGQRPHDLVFFPARLGGRTFLGALGTLSFRTRHVLFVLYRAPRLHAQRLHALAGLVLK